MGPFMGDGDILGRPDPRHDGAGRGPDSVIDAVGMEVPEMNAAADLAGRRARRGRIRHAPDALDDAPAAYEAFQRKTDGTIKVLLKP